GLHAQIDDFAFARNAGAVHDVELCLLEGRRHLVLDDLDARFVADDFVAFLDGTDASDVETDRRIELERVTTRGGFRVAEHDADLHADLVDEDDHAVGALDGGRELAQCLAHEACLQTRQRITHVAFDFGLGRERRDGVDDDEINGTRTHQGISDFECLLARVGLRDEQVFEVDAQLGGVLDVERVFGVDEGAGAAKLLHFGDDLQRKRGLARGFRTIDFDDTPARQTAYAQRDVKTERPGGNHLNVVLDLVVAIAHDRTLAELLFNL